MSSLDFGKLLRWMEESPKSTPFYAYDASAFRGSYSALRSALPDGIGIFYSMKANPHPAVLEAFESLGALIDVSSLGELEASSRAGFSPGRVSFVGPGKSLEELRAGVQAGVFCLVAESIDEIRAIQRVCSGLGRQARVCIRVNPRRYLHSSGGAKSDLPSQFGIDEESLGEAIGALNQSKDVSSVGLHFYLQSQYLSAEDIAANFRSFIEIAERFAKSSGKALEVVNLGGGFGIPYFEGQKDLDLPDLRARLDGLPDLARKRLGDGARLFVESGRFLVGPAGVFVTKALYRKVSRGTTYLVCDGGLTQHLAAVGFGQMVRRPFPLRVLKATGDGLVLLDDSQGTEEVTLVGPSCYGLDTLGQRVRIPRVEPGDFVCVLQSGAYGPTFSPGKFLSRPEAGEFILS